VARDRAFRPEAKPLRLFVAADVPQVVKDGLARDTAPFKDKIPGARWTQPSGWHVTLKFLGWVWPRLEGTVREAVTDVAARTGPGFAARLTSIGAFPSPNRARVLWAGLEDDPSGRFAEVVKQLDDALEEHFEPEQREFTPHLTVARFQPPVPVADTLEGIEVASRPFEVDRLVLYRSHLQRPAPRYEAIEEFPLG